MELDLMQKRVEHIQTMKDSMVDMDVEGNEIKFFSSEFLVKKYLKLSDADLKLNDKLKQEFVANASHAAEAKMYNVAGVCVGTYAFEVGYNDVKMPSEVGVYTMQVVYDSDKIQVIRIVVRK